MHVSPSSRLGLSIDTNFNRTGNYEGSRRETSAAGRDHASPAPSKTGSHLIFVSKLFSCAGPIRSAESSGAWEMSR